MNEDNQAAPNFQTLLNAPVAGTSAGALLRAARAAQGMHIAVLAVALKVSVQKLEMLENDEFERLGDTVFVRALAASVCRILKVDVAPILHAMPSLERPAIKLVEPASQTTFTREGEGTALQKQLKNPLSLAALALLVGILGVVFWPRGALDQSDASAPSGALQVPGARKPVAVQVPTPMTAISVLPGASATTSDLAQATAPAPGAAVQSSVLLLQARGVSWLEVVDAKGTLQVRKFIQSGEQLPVMGELPLHVVLGRADLVSVQLRGKTFDVGAFTKNNVARFEVK